MEFSPADFTEIESKYRPQYWPGAEGFERPYSDAIAYGNMSFIKSFEKWKGRKPFLANNVRPCLPYPKLIHRLSTRARGRLAINSEFGDGWKVTSINGDILVAVRERPKREVVKFTHEKLREMFPKPKQPKRPMSDYKYEMQLLAEEAAEEQHGKDFYSLSQAEQDRIYKRAMLDWHDKQAERAELLEDR